MRGVFPYTRCTGMVYRCSVPGARYELAVDVDIQHYFNISMIVQQLNTYMVYVRVYI